MLTSTSPTTRPHLTTGWEPEADLAAANTVVRQFVLHLAESSASMAAANGGVTVRTDRYAIADTMRPAAFNNSGILLQPLPYDDWTGTVGQIEALVDRQGSGGDFYLWSAWPTPDLHDRGWELMGHPPILVRQPGGRLPDAPDGLDIVQVGSTQQLRDWERVAVEGYPFRDLMPYTPGCLLDDRILEDDRWSFWVGYDNGRPVSVGGLFVSHGFAQLALGVSLPDTRGRGYWYGMVRERLLAARDLLSGSMFSDYSRPGIERLGYLPISRLTLWRRSRSA